jgi:hypothetical protein
LLSAVITGFNTDVEYDGKVYHVQTEDKGVDTPVIVSLVYQGGTILASKRSPYDDLLKDGIVDEKALAERLSKQHKLICAAIKAGRIEDLKRMSMKESSPGDKQLVVKRNFNESRDKGTILEQPESRVDSVVLVTDSKPEEEIIELPAEVIEEALIGEVVEIEETMLPEEAVEILQDFSELEVSETEHVKIELLGAPVFKGGDRKVLSVLITNAKTKQIISNALVTVKVLGSSFRPLIYQARTDENGLAIVNLQIPHFKSGRAAILIRALYNGEETEIRQIVKPG